MGGVGVVAASSAEFGQIAQIGRIGGARRALGEAEFRRVVELARLAAEKPKGGTSRRRDAEADRRAVARALRGGAVGGPLGPFEGSRVRASRSLFREDCRNRRLSGVYCFAPRLLAGSGWRRLWLAL